MQISHVRKSRLTTTIRFISQSDSTTLPDFTGEADQLTVRYDGDRTTVYCGTGPENDCTPAMLRTVAAKAAQSLQKLKRTSAACVLPTLPLGGAVVEKSIIEGLLLGSYSFAKYKSEKKESLSRIDIIGGALSTSALRSVQHACEGVTYTRDIVNDNASVVTPQFLAKEARRIAKEGDMKLTILDEQELIRKKLGLISAVGSGSTTPPVLIILEYRGDSRNGKKTAIVGKGVTFDSGGQNLKPTGSIESMRHDMAGAAAVLGLFSAIARIRPKMNVIGVIPAVHNAIGSRAFFPGDIYTAHNGKTVEIWSTDAEGRLILADAISYCREACNPDRIIDLATLTGGIVTALGELVAGLFANNDDLAQQLFAAGETANERLWRFPLYKEYCDSLRGELGDLRNLSKFKKGQASSIIGAAFIKEFVGEVPWAHLDIAGTAWNEGGSRGEIPQFATGFGVRLLMEFLGV